MDSVLESAGVQVKSPKNEPRLARGANQESVGPFQSASKSEDFEPDDDFEGQTERVRARDLEDAEPGGEAETELQLELLSSYDRLDEFYANAAVSALLRILKDQTLLQHHADCLTAITKIFEVIGLQRALGFLPTVFPSYLRIV